MRAIPSSVAMVERALVLLVGLAWSGTAEAAFPGENGKVVYQREGEVYSLDLGIRAEENLTDLSGRV